MLMTSAGLSDEHVVCKVLSEVDAGPRHVQIPRLFHQQAPVSTPMVSPFILPPSVFAKSFAFKPEVSGKGKLRQVFDIHRKMIACPSFAMDIVVGIKI